jgi:glycosyltransferase involved in cell wall biosynthesis
MRCPTLKELPPSPPGKTGWPWTEESPQLPDTMPDGSPWPKTSIVTPSLNQGQFIEETIRSVLLQGYPNLEYIIVDGGSTDGTIEIIKKYEKWLAYWVSEKDRGQAHAINKGFSMATGDMLAWINSDDMLEIDALQHVANSVLQSPGAIVLGNVLDYVQGTNKTYISRQHNISMQSMLKPSDGSWNWHQPGTFVPRDVQRMVGKLDEQVHYAFDKDWIFRLISIAPVCYLGRIVSRFRIHPEAKTSVGMDKWINEIYMVNGRYLDCLQKKERRQLKALYHLRLAGLYLVEHEEYVPFFNRWRGGKELLDAFRHDPALCLFVGFDKLLRRLLLPRFLWRSK